MEQFFLSVKNLNVTIGSKHVLKDISFDIGPDEQWAIVGAAGSGKSVLAHTLLGRHFFSGVIKTNFGGPENFHHAVSMVEQQHHFKDITNRSDFYYQQRYNSFDAEQTLTVAEYLATFLNVESDSSKQFSKGELLQLLQIDQLLDEPLIQLSNGENKRLQLVKALLQKRELLILDQPFIGLDSAGRELLKNMLDRLNQEKVHILLITSPHQIPDYITHVAMFDNGSLIAALPKNDFNVADFNVPSLPMIIDKNLLSISELQPQDFEIAIKMVDVNIRYSDKNILSHINWEVRKGEKWGLSGPNGAGKSTLLSLITGDNPQAYANEIYLFDRRRGSGESIWDIKKKIGYISPELHLYFDFSANAFQAIASGLFDTIGLFRQINHEQELLVMKWLQLIGLDGKQHQLLKNFSLGEQRFILLARALIKNPPLLILDEPCQGLDDAHVYSFKKLVNDFCNTYSTTLIYVTHYTEEIPDTIDHFLKIDHGIVMY